MFWGNKQKNNRSKKHNVLAVKRRSDKVRAERLRLFTSVLTTTFLVSMVLLLFWRGGQILLDRILFENEFFSIRKLVVRTTGTLDPAYLARWGEVQRGDNLLAVDLGRIKNDIERIPLVEAVMVERVLPDTLRIRIKERVPKARAQVHLLDQNYKKVFFYFDESGHVIPEMEPAAFLKQSEPDWNRLPLVLGAPGEQLRPGGRVQSAPFRACLEFIREFEKSSMDHLVRLEFVDISHPHVLTISTHTGSRITLGFQDLPWQIYRWQLVHEDAMANNRHILTLDLSIKRNPPVRWVPLPDAPLMSAHSKF